MTPSPPDPPPRCPPSQNRKVGSMTTTTTHAFDTAIDLAHNGDGHYVGQTTPEFANMVGPFGGVTAAAIVRAISDHPPDRIGDPPSP